MVKKTENRKGFWTTSLGKTLSFLGKYTGISWLSKKVLSGLNWVFGGQPQKFSDTSFIAEGGEELYLLPTEAHNRTLNKSMKKSKFRVSISTGKGPCYITGSGPYYTSDTPPVICYKISSVESRDHGASDKLKKMKGKLGFTGETKTIAVTEISEAPEVESSESTVSDKAQLTNPEQSFIKVTNKGQLRLHATIEHMLTLGTNKNKDNINEFRVLIITDEGSCCITGNGPHYTSTQMYYNINSIAGQDGTNVSKDPKEIREKLGLVGEKKFVNITEMSKVPLKVPEAAPTIPSSEKKSANGKEPRSTSADLKLQQLTGNTKSGSGP